MLIGNIQRKHSKPETEIKQAKLQLKASFRNFLGIIFHIVLFCFSLGITLSILYSFVDTALLMMIGTVISLGFTLWLSQFWNDFRIRIETAAVRVSIPSGLLDLISNSDKLRTQFKLFIITKTSNPKLPLNLAFATRKSIYLHESYLAPSQEVAFTAVLAHELSHLILKHPQKKLSQTSIWIGLALMGTLLICSASTGLMHTWPVRPLWIFTALSYPVFTGSVLTAWVLYKLSCLARLQEHQADQHAVSSLKVDKNQYIQALHLVSSKKRTWFHPSAQQRIQSI